MRKRVSILGSGISGVGAAILAKDKGYEVFVSDSNEITSNVKNKLDFNIKKRNSVLKKVLEFQMNQRL